MKCFHLVTVALLITAASATAAKAQVDVATMEEIKPEEWSCYGDSVTFGGMETSVTRAVEKSEEHGRTIRVHGTVSDVCRKKGCWLTVTDGVSEMRVTFRDYGFFVPMNCVGNEVVIEGVVSEEEVSEELAKHYAEESGNEDPDAIEGPRKVVTMVADGVRLRTEPQ